MALSQLEVTGAEVYATTLGDELTTRGHQVWYVSDTLTCSVKGTFFPLAFNRRSIPRRLWHVARLVDGGANDIGIEASMLKLRASDIAMRIATEAVQLHGGYGYCKDYRVERLMRDAKITQIWEGTNQVHRQLIGRSFLAKP